MQLSTRRNFKDKPLEERKRLSQEELRKDPDCVPTVLQPRKNLTSGFSYKKYSIQGGIKVVNLVQIFNRDVKLVGKQKGLYLFAGIKQKMLNNSDAVKQVYELYRDKDGWLYLQYDTPHTLG